MQYATRLDDLLWTPKRIALPVETPSLAMTTPSTVTLPRVEPLPLSQAAGSVMPSAMDTNIVNQTITSDQTQRLNFFYDLQQRCFTADPAVVFLFVLIFILCIFVIYLNNRVKTMETLVQFLLYQQYYRAR